jgi:hypothetical protein
VWRNGGAKPLIKIIQMVRGAARRDAPLASPERAKSIAQGNALCRANNPSKILSLRGMRLLIFYFSTISFEKN